MKTKLTFTLIMISLFLVGCTTQHNDNYLEIHKSYLTYAFGDYDIITDKVSETDLSPVPGTAVHRNWEISYQDDKDETHSFRFSNYGGSDTVDNFEYFIYFHLSNRINEMIEKDYITKKFTEYIQSESIYLTTNLIPSRKSYKDLIHKKTGINFQSLDGKELSKYDFSLNFMFQIKLEKGLTLDSANNTIENDKIKVVELMNDLYQDLGYQDMVATLSLYNNEVSAKYDIYYDNSTDEYMIEKKDY